MYSMHQTFKTTVSFPSVQYRVVNGQIDISALLFTSHSTKTGATHKMYTYITNLSTNYLMLCKAYTDEGGIK